MPFIDLIMQELGWEPKPKFNYKLWLTILCLILAFTIYKFIPEQEPDYPPKNYTGQRYTAFCPECQTVFYNSWDGRRCPEDHRLLMNNAYNKENR